MRVTSLSSEQQVVATGTPAGQLAAAFGADRILFGSNYPMITPKDCLEGIDALDIPADILDKFLSETARSVFRL